MNTLLTVVVVLLIGVGYALGGYFAENKYLARARLILAAWQDQVLTLNAKAKEMEDYRLIGEAHNCLLKIQILEHCIATVQEDLARESRRVI